MTVVFKRNVFESITKSLPELDAVHKWQQKKQYVSATLDIDLDCSQILMLAIATRHHLINLLREKKIPRELSNNVPAILLLSRKVVSDEETARHQFTLSHLLKAQKAMIYGLMKSNLSYGLMLALEELRIWVEIYEQNKYELTAKPDKNELLLSFTYFQRERKQLSANDFPMMTREFYSNGLTNKSGKSFECRFEYYAEDTNLITEHIVFLLEQLKFPLAERLGLLNNFKRQIQTFEKAVPAYQQPIFQKLAEDLRGKIFAFLENIPTGNTMLPNAIFAEAKTALEISEIRRSLFVEEVVRFAKQDLNPRKPMFKNLDAVFAALDKQAGEVLDIFLHKLESTEKDRMISRLLVMNETNIMMLVDKMRTTLSQKGIDPSKAKVADIMEVTFSDPWRSIDALLKAIQMKGVSKDTCKQIELRIYDEAETQKIGALQYLLKMKEHYQSDLDRFIKAATKPPEN